jgi:serine protease AprX
LEALAPRRIRAVSALALAALLSALVVAPSAQLVVPERVTAATVDGVQQVRERLAATTAALAALVSDGPVAPDLATATGTASGVPADATAPAALGASALWAAGIDGDGVGIAVVDTGVAEVAALEGRVLPGVDLTGEGTTADVYGHGTPIAGLAAGVGTGVAPGAHIVPVRIGGADGVTDTGRLLAGLGWILENHAEQGIRVVNLSLGVAEADAAVVQAAVERLWDAGLVVVVAAGNEADAPLGALAADPLVVTVGSTLGQGTATVADDLLAPWNTTGVDVDGNAKPDLVAPGQSLVTTGAPGSWGYESHPEGHVGDGLQRVTGTSYSAALVSGAAALLVQANPDWTPDEVLGALRGTGSSVAGTAATLPSLEAAAAVDEPVAENVGATRTGVGPLVELGPSAPAGLLTGTPHAWNGSNWYGSNWYGSNWYGSNWYGSNWYGSNWYGSNWY